MAEMQPKPDIARLAERRLEVVVGNPHAIHGQTRVRVDGDGALRAELWKAPPGKDRAARRPEQQLAAEGRLAPSQTEQVFRMAEQLNWNRKFPDRPGVPDESIVEFQLTAGGEKSSARFWVHDAEQDPRCGPVLELLRAEMRRASNGKIYL